MLARPHPTISEVRRSTPAVTSATAEATDGDAPSPRPYSARVARAVGLLALSVWLHANMEAPVRTNPPYWALSEHVAGRLIALPGIPVSPLSLSVGAPPLSFGLPPRVTLQTMTVTVPPTRSFIERLRNTPEPHLLAVGTSGRTLESTPPPPVSARVLPAPNVRTDEGLVNEAVAAAERTDVPQPVASAVVQTATAAYMPAVPEVPLRTRDLKGPAVDPAEEARQQRAEEIRRQKEVILTVLREYTRAFERLDVRAAEALYPSVDRRRLERAFRNLEEQQLQLADCDVSFTSAGGAAARCAGSATYRPKVGSRVVRLTDQEWTFSLARGGGGWQILEARIN